MPGLVTDVDGTIGAIYLVSERAFVLPRTREALTGLHTQLDLVASVSGRTASDA